MWNAPVSAPHLIGEAEPGGDEAEVRGRRVGEEFLDVGRAERADRGDGHSEQAEAREEEHPLLAGEERAGPTDEEDAGLHHRGGVEEGRDGRGGFHRAREPEVERDLGGFGGRAERDEAEDREEESGVPEGGPHRVGVRNHRIRAADEGERGGAERDPGGVREEDEADEHEQAAGNGNDERLARGGLGALRVAVVADEAEGGDRGELPEDEEGDQVGGERDAEHRAHEREQGGVVAGLPGFVVHVARRVGEDQDADAARE